MPATVDQNRGDEPADTRDVPGQNVGREMHAEIDPAEPDSERHGDC